MKKFVIGKPVKVSYDKRTFYPVTDINFNFRLFLTILENDEDLHLPTQLGWTNGKIEFRHLGIISDYGG